MNWLLLKNSFLVSGAATGLAVVFGFLAALWTTGLERRARGVMLAIAAVALALPPFVATNCWLHFLGATGVWHSWLPLNIFSLGGAIWILALLTWPITMFLVTGALRRLEPSQLESDLEIAGWALIRGLLLPLGGTAMAQAAAVTFILALNNFAVPTILQVKVFTEEIWIRFNTAFDTRGALLLSWPLMLLPLLVLVWLARREIRWPRMEATVPPKFFRQQLGGVWFGVCGVGTIIICALSVGLPVFQLLSARRTWVELPGALAAGKWAVWYSVFFAAVSATGIVGVAFACAPATPLKPYRYSWRHKLAPTTAGTIQLEKSSPSPRPSPPGRGGIFARLFERSPFGKIRELETMSTRPVASGLENFEARKSTASLPLKRGVNERASSRSWNLLTLFGLLAWLPFLIPGVLLGIALIAIFNHTWSSGFYQSAGIVVLAFVIRYFGLGWNTIARAVQGVDRDLADVARLNGANRLQMLRYVHLPQIGPLAAAAWYVVFLLCLWDVESMILVTPPGGETLALRIFNLLHYGHNGQVNALCLALLGLALAPLIVWSVGRGAYSVATFRGSRATRPDIRSLRSTLPILFTAVLLLTGCSPASSSNESSLKSRLFSHVQIIGTRGVGVGELNKPRSVAVDRKDNLYVVDMTGRVQKFSPDGAFMLFWQLPQTDKGKPKGMCRDDQGNIVVVEPHYQRVNHFSTEGSLLSQWGRYGTNAGQFSMPRAIAIDSHGDAYVSEYGLVERVERFSLRSALNVASVPRFIATFGHMGSATGEFNRPEGLCVDSQDRLYVADSCNHRIQIFSPEGKFLRAYGKAGTGKGELGYPYDICVDAAGFQFVCEFGNSRIQVFDAHDQPVEIIGGPGAAPGRFSNPWGVALDSAGNLYVADSLNHRVQKLVRNKAVARSEYSVFSVQCSELNSRKPLAGRGSISKQAAVQDKYRPLVNSLIH
jgi:ABC-type Fe3+ transport system permease subunit/DNA-binding beta-propeller fold protein YncE